VILQSPLCRLAAAALRRGSGRDWHNAQKEERPATAAGRLLWGRVGAKGNRPSLSEERGYPGFRRVAAPGRPSDSIPDALGQDDPALRPSVIDSPAERSCRPTLRRILKLFLKREKGRRPGPIATPCRRREKKGRPCPFFCCDDARNRLLLTLFEKMRRRSSSAAVPTDPAPRRIILPPKEITHVRAVARRRSERGGRRPRP
jgi:hypothetical protein